MEKVVANLDELKREAGEFARSLRPQPRMATLVTLSGDLGAGKTAFTQQLAASLGIADTVTSPTFVIEKIYQIPADVVKRIGAPEYTPFFKRFIHIDAYRLESAGELAPLGFDELMQNDQNLVVLEWPEKVADALPPPTHRILLAAQPDGSRRIAYA